MLALPFPMHEIKQEQEDSGQVIVVIHLPNDKLTARTRRIFEQAGYDEIMREYSEKKAAFLEKFTKLRSKSLHSKENENNERAPFIPEIFTTITSGCKLRAKYVIHIDIREMKPLRSGRVPTLTEQTLTKKVSILRECYKQALDCAYQEIKPINVTIPLLGNEIFDCSFDLDYIVAKEELSKWCRQNNSSHCKGMVIRFILPREPEQYCILPDFSIGLKYFQFGEQMNDAIEKFAEKNNCQSLNDNDLKPLFYSDRVVSYMRRNIDSNNLTNEKLAETIGYGAPSSISNIKNGKTKVIHKRKAVAMAIALGLTDDYERYEFINSLSDTHKYPDDRIDRMVEGMFNRGITDFEEINNELCKMNPDFSLKKDGNN